MPRVDQPGKAAKSVQPVKPVVFGPYWQTTDEETVRLYLGDVLETLRKLPSESVQCAITSPPYWALRDYGTGTWEGGKAECDHIRRDLAKSGMDGHTRNSRRQGRTPPDPIAYSFICAKCGARRTDAQLGSERKPDCLGWAKGENCAQVDWGKGCHVCRMVLVFRELRRVLRDDGTLWLNYGDTYANTSCGGESPVGPRKPRATDKARMDSMKRTRQETYGNLKAGNLMGIPWRVALALQSDGWILRQDIIWHKPSSMPESVRDRCTKAHEYLFLFSKRKDYYCDMEAIKEASIHSGRRTYTTKKGGAYRQAIGMGREPSGNGRLGMYVDTAADRNKRSVWTIASQGYEGAHYACFPRALVEPCIRAGTSEKGCCIECGTPWTRVVSGGSGGAKGQSWLGWEQGCKCRTEEVVPCIVMDPFIGSGTTAAVAIGEGRYCWGIDLSEKYLKNNAIPRIEGVLLDIPAMVGLVPRRAAQGK